MGAIIECTLTVHQIPGSCKETYKGIFVTPVTVILTVYIQQKQAKFAQIPIIGADFAIFC